MPRTREFRGSGDPKITGRISGIEDTMIVVVNHGADSAVPRPQHATCVYWIGSVVPANLQASDLYSYTVSAIEDRLDAHDAAPYHGTTPLLNTLGPGYFGTAGSTMNLATGVAYFCPFIAKGNITVGSFFVATGSAAPTTPVSTLGRIGLYTWAVNTWTLVARCESDTTLWTVVDVPYTEPFATTGGYPATYTLVAGAKYAIGFLVVGTGTMTARCNNFRLAAVATALDAGWRIGSQTDLPVTQTQAGLTAEAAVPWGDLIAV